MATWHYSISSSPQRRDAYEIAVLHDGEGSAVTHRDYALGLTLRCGPPLNAFPLHDGEGPVLLVAGGIGITPLKAMVEACTAQGRDVRLHYAARSPSEAPYRRELLDLLGENGIFSTPDHRIDVGAILGAAPTDATVYVCGSERLIEAVRIEAARLGWSEDRLRLERFTPPPPAADDRPFDLVLARSGERVTVAADETALGALERIGAPVASSYRTSACGTCVTRLLAGEPDHRDSSLDAARRAGGGSTPCVSRARSTELTLDL